VLSCLAQTVHTVKQCADVGLRAFATILLRRDTEYSSAAMATSGQGPARAAAGSGDFSYGGGMALAAPEYPGQSPLPGSECACRGCKLWELRLLMTDLQPLDEAAQAERMVCTPTPPSQLTHTSMIKTSSAWPSKTPHEASPTPPPHPPHTPAAARTHLGHKARQVLPVLPSDR
jgi:hypothetical protein